MRAVIQRVSSASVSINGRPSGAIDRGYVVLLGVAAGDGEAEARFLAGKTANLRVMEDDAGKMNLSLVDAEGEVLVISQFTLLADCRKGRRPNFIRAAPPEEADRLYGLYVKTLRDMGLKVATGVFAARMLVEIANDGPVTIMLDTTELM